MRSHAKTKVLEEIVAAIRDSRFSTVVEIAKKFGLKERTARSYLSSLVKEGRLKRKHTLQDARTKIYVFNYEAS